MEQKHYPQDATSGQKSLGDGKSKLLDALKRALQHCFERLACE